MHGLIFDVDGVLGNTEGPVCRATMAMFEELCGCTMEPDDFLPFVGTGAVRYVAGPAEKYGLEIDIDRAVARRHENFVKIIGEEDIAFPGAAALVETVAALPGWKLGIATSSPGESSRPTLKAAGIDLDLFDAYINGDMITHKKPHPEIYLKAAETLGLAPGRCVVVEDAVTGVASAKAAGMRVIALTHTFAAELLQEADLILPAIADITVPMLHDLAGAPVGEA